MAVCAAVSVLVERIATDLAAATRCRDWRHDQRFLSIPAIRGLCITRFATSELISKTPAEIGHYRMAMNEIVILITSVALMAACRCSA